MKTLFLSLSLFAFILATPVHASESTSTSWWSSIQKQITQLQDKISDLIKQVKELIDKYVHPGVQEADSSTTTTRYTFAENPDIVVNIISHTFPISVGDDADIEVATSSNSCEIVSVTFFVDDEEVETDTSKPFTYYWKPEAGVHVIKAVVTDCNGVQAYATKKITVGGASAIAGDGQTPPPPPPPVPTPWPSPVYISDNYLGSDYHGNYVWSGAMNLAWNELNDNILHEKLKLQTTDATVLRMVEKLNNAPFSKDDLDSASYYIKSGYGQETVDQINRESKAKFPSKSFADLTMTLRPEDIISYAYFLKEVEYEYAFSSDVFRFNGNFVEGFYANGRKQRGNVGVISYQNQDKFIITLRLKGNDMMFLAKGYDMHDPREVLQAIEDKRAVDLAHPTLGDDEVFQAPKLRLDYHREYRELINRRLANQGFTKYVIAQMFENIKFDMDEKGARVENEGVIGARATSSGVDENLRSFILDKPYWIIMRQKRSHRPYFMLGVNNTRMMIMVTTDEDVSLDNNHSDDSGNGEGEDESHCGPNGCPVE